MSIQVLALDLERTLIDDARSGRPRPGLLEFLLFCDAAFARLAVFSTVETEEARVVLAELERQGHLPPGLPSRLEYIDWHGEFKSLAFVPDAAPGEVLLIDDDAGWIHPDQRSQWIPIAPWDGGPDRELARIHRVLLGWMN